MNKDDVLFITLDSCRYDTFEAAFNSGSLPNIQRIGELHKTTAPSHFTYGSHASFWMGFTPGVSNSSLPYLNPKAGKIFRMAHPGLKHSISDSYLLEGKNIIDGFNNKGYLTIGSGSVEWFNPETETGAVLGSDFQRFFFSSNTWSLKKQLQWIDEVLSVEHENQNTFCFINIGETHVPYWHEGADWERWPSPCVPFGDEHSSAAESARRQRACLEWVDRQLIHLLERFRNGTVLVCADHGDCWGEDGLWEHGISHSATLTTPLVMQVRGVPVRATQKLASTSPTPSRFRSAASRLKKWWTARL